MQGCRLRVLALDPSSSLAEKKTRLWDKICQQFSEIQARRDRRFTSVRQPGQGLFRFIVCENRASLNSNEEGVAFLHRCI